VRPYQTEYLVKFWGLDAPAFAATLEEPPYEDLVDHLGNPQENGARYVWFEDEASAWEFQKRVLAFPGTIVAVVETGPDCRVRTVAVMRLVFPGGVEVPLRDDFGWGYSVDSARFMWLEGNYSCDCNRSSFAQQLGYEVPDMECGDLVACEDFRVEQAGVPPLVWAGALCREIRP
jgi:hypothetical protein